MLRAADENTIIASSALLPIDLGLLIFQETGLKLTLLVVRQVMSSGEVALD